LGFDFALVAAFAFFFGAAFFAAGFLVVFFARGVDAAFDAAAGSWIRDVVNNVRRVATKADKVKTEEDTT